MDQQYNVKLVNMYYNYVIYYDYYRIFDLEVTFLYSELQR